MPDPSRDSTAGRVFLDLRALAKRQGRSTDELLVFYVLERFLYRLSRSAWADRLVLKGGLLLAVLDTRRATRDADLLGLSVDAQPEHILPMVAEIVAIDCDDGVVFLPDAARAQTIRADAQYTGTRITMPCQIGRARSTLALDVNVGDPVTPGARTIAFPQLLDAGTIPILGYPTETVLAEKLTTMIVLGDANTRERDWADVWRLTGAHDLAGSAIETALTNTATYRGIRLQPLNEIIDTLPRDRQEPYAVWRARHAGTVQYPDTFDDLVRAVIAFADPPLARRTAGLTWTCRDRQWGQP